MVGSSWINVILNDLTRVISKWNCDVIYCSHDGVYIFWGMVFSQNISLHLDLIFISNVKFYRVFHLCFHLFFYFLWNWIYYQNWCIRDIYLNGAETIHNGISLFNSLCVSWGVKYSMLSYIQLMLSGSDQASIYG